MVDITSLKNKIKQLETSLKVLKEQLADAEADVLEPSQTCCGIIYTSKKEWDFHRATKKCMLKRKLPHFRCKVCNKRFFDGYWSLADLEQDDEAYQNSTYRRHVNPINNPDACKTYCDYCDVAIESLYMATKHKSCGKNSKPVCPKVEEPEPEPVRKEPVKRKKFILKPKPKPPPSPEPSPEPVSEYEYESYDEDEISLDEIKIDGYLYGYHRESGAIFDEFYQYIGQAEIDDMDYVFGIDRSYDKPPKKKVKKQNIKSNVKYI